MHKFSTKPFNPCKESPHHPQMQATPYTLNEIFGEYLPSYTEEMLSDLSWIVQITVTNAKYDKTASTKEVTE